MGYALSQQKKDPVFGLWINYMSKSSEHKQHNKIQIVSATICLRVWIKGWVGGGSM